MRKFILIFALAAALAGCKATYRGGKIVEGVDAFVGVNAPLSDGMMQFEVLNYLSGARFSFDRNAGITFEYSVTNVVSFLGYESVTTKHMKATLDPTEETATNAVVRAEAEMK